MKQITLYFESADGKPDRCTGMHVDHGDGTASWLASGALDLSGPEGSGKTWREVGERSRDDAKPLPKYSKPTNVIAPSVSDFISDKVEIIK